MELVDRIFFSAWVAFVVPALLLLVCGEIGFRASRRAFVEHDSATRSTIGGIQGAILGLLGLLLGFTFAIGAARFEDRRTLVVKEANAIGTTYLRAALLPAADVEPMRSMLREYVELRLEVYPLLDDRAVLDRYLRRSAELQRMLWDRAVAAAQAAPTPPVALFVAALNETIDTETERLAAGRARIPPSIWVLLLIVAGLGCVTSSYAAGAEGARTAFSNFVLPVLIATVMTLIFDITHPREGFIGVSQQPLIDLQQSIAPAR